MERRSTALITLVMMGGAIAGILLSSRPPPPTVSSDARTTTSTSTAPAPAPREAREALAGTELDRRIEAERRFAETSRSWVDWDVLAAHYLDRAALGGGLEDLGRANDALDRAFALADRGAGPHLRRAILDFRLHRLDECEAMLDVFDGYGVTSVDDRLTAESLHADVAFFRGEYAIARTAYERSLARSRDAVGLFSLARLEWSTGRAARAVTLLDEASALDPEGRVESFLAVAHATLARERGDIDEAVRRATRALALRPDHPDTILLLAELRLEQGDLDAADALVTRALAIDDAPQAHELAARVARTRGDAIAMEEHRSAATRAIEALYPRFPEAVAGHALLHFLRFEDEARAIEMAEVNAHARPFGEARARLALAYLRAARTEDARREIDAVLATEWSTGESHAIAAEIFGAVRDARARTERELAEQLAPGTVDRVADLRRR